MQEIFLPTLTMQKAGDPTPSILEGFQAMLGIQGPYSLTLSILRRKHPTFSIRENGSPTLRLEGARIADWRCQIGGHPSLSLRETAFPPWRFQEMKNEMVSCLTLAVRSLGITECLAIVEIVGTETLIMLPTFWTTFFMKFGVVAKMDLSST